MARVPTPPILSSIQSARSYAEQAAALRSLKNEIVGHAQKQHRWVAHDVLEPIVVILLSARSPAKPNGKNTRTNGAVSLKPLSEEEQVRLQAIQLLASFANGGAAFLTPLYAAGALPALLENLCPVDNHPRIVLATLKALRSFADAAWLASPACQFQPSVLADDIFAEQHLDSLCNIIVAPGSLPSMSSSLVNAAAGLIGDLCREERHQILIAKAEILDALATRLASFVVSRGEVVPGADVIARNEGLAEAMPGPAPPGLSLAAILDAISAIVADSRLRACMLLYSPSILAVFPNLDFLPPTKAIRTAWDALESVNLDSARPSHFGAIDYLLPVVPAQPKNTSPQISPFPPLGTTRDYSSSNTGRVGPSRSASSFTGRERHEQHYSAAEGTSTEDPEVPLIPWLMHLAMTSSGTESLLAVDVLTSLYKAGFASRSREAMLASLAVPLLMRLLPDGDKVPGTAISAWVDRETAARWDMTERTLTVLARLITDSELLQKAAFDGQAVRAVCKLLKDAYEPIKAHDHLKLWSPTPQDEPDMLETSSSSSTAGPRGQLPLQRHRIRLREAALKALASLVSFKNDFRKAVCEQDAVSYVVESLTEDPRKPSSGSRGQAANKPGAAAATAAAGSGDGEEAPSSSAAGSAYGHNSVGVLIAACHTVRILSRSMSVIRTTLQDAGVTKPLFDLLRHPDVDVRIAATGAICNLVTEISPMRERYTELGVMKILCEHAHSMNADLRLNALWALKHYVHGLRPEMKKDCLQELQPGWLVQLICDDTEDDALFTRGKSGKQSETRSAASAGDDMDEDVEMDQPDDDDDDAGSKHWTGTSTPSSSMLRGGPGTASPRVSHERSRTGRLRHAEAKLAALRDAELNPQRKARSDDLAIQEQGLNFIRNLIMTSSTGGGAGANLDYPQDSTEMIDYLFNELGQDRLFEILASKLRVKVLHPFSRRVSPPSTAADQGQQQGSRVLYPQAKVIEAVVCILVHIAASVPRHRQLVISQTELLRLLAQQFGSRDKDVRVSLCHLVSNLTWRDNSADTQASKRRAEELRRLGLLDRLESLQQDDAELDVRERAKSAVWQMKQGGAGDVSAGGGSMGRGGGLGGSNL